MVAALMSSYDFRSNCSPKMDDCLNSLGAFVFAGYLANGDQMLEATQTLGSLSLNSAT